jgi:N-acetylmuramoyl-L-alanine amidase
MDDIQRAFKDSTLANTDGKSYDSTVSVDLSSKLKLRTKYYIGNYMPKNQGLLVSGIGQINTAKMFCLNSPKRAVIDLPNTYLEKSIRNKEINLCPDGSCKDTAKIGQFEYNKARIVITSDNAEKYIPIYSQDAQSLFLINSDKLNHASLASNVSNINKAYVKKIDAKTNEIILSFTSPVVYSFIKSDNNLSFYLFNVKSYNEQDMIKTLNNSAYKQFTLSLLPQIGVKATMPINKDDMVKVEQSMDSKALKLTITKAKEEAKAVIEKPVTTTKKAEKNKVVLDAGHGGSDYGAIREGINEKDITLDVTQRVEAILRSKGYKTTLTRKDDTFVSLEDRVNISEKESPEIFVSIHVNSAVSTEPNGIETHYYHDYSKELAEVVHKHLIKENSNSKDRGLFKSKFYVINHTTVPAILCEIGFISNENERNELITDARKNKTAKAIAEGIIEYLKLTGGKK